MFLNLKKRIKELARNAVFAAEKELGTGNGQKKKKLAIDYIVKNLPVPEIVKSVISILLSSFIDDAVEIAVSYMNSLPKNQGD